MIRISAKFDATSERRIAQFTNPRRVRWAEKEAVNIAGTRTAKLAHKLVADEMGIDRAKLRKRGRQVKPRGKNHGTVSRGRAATLRKLRTTVDGYGKPFNVTRWDAKPIKEGNRTVGVFHEAWGRRQFAPRTWRLNVRGNPIVKRDASKGYVNGVFGPGVTHVMEYPHIERQIVRRAQRVLRVQFVKRLRYAFSSQSHLRY